MSIPMLFEDPLGLEDILTNAENISGFTYVVGNLTPSMTYDTPYAEILQRKVAAGAKGIPFYALVYYTNPDLPSAVLRPIKDEGDYYSALYYARQRYAQVHMLAIRQDSLKAVEQIWGDKVTPFAGHFGIMQP